MSILSIVVSILIFGLIIFIHELGHFIAAKLSGITVLQFSIGFGPALIKKQVGETLYAIRIIPLGGAVMMKGADEEEELLVGKTPGATGTAPELLPEVDGVRLSGDEEPGSYYSVSKWRRFWVCAAGPLMNFVFGVIVLLILFVPAQAVRTPTLSGFMDGFAYDDPSYFQAGDRLVNVNGFHAFTLNDVFTALLLGEGQPMTFTVERDGARHKIESLAFEKTLADPDTGELKYGLIFSVEEVGALGKVKYAVNNAMSYVQSAVKSLQMLFTGKAGVKDMMGTVGIASEISDRVQQSAWDTWAFVAFISVNLAFMNLLPIPALDGGKLLFLLIEAVRGKRVSAKVEGYVSMASLLLILGLFVVVTYNDIARIVAG